MCLKPAGDTRRCGGDASFFREGCRRRKTAFLLFTKLYLFSPHLEFALQILDVAGQRRSAPWPPANFNRKYACKQSISD